MNIQTLWFIRNPNFIYRKIVDEFILVPIHQDVADMECIYTLNSVGAFIWQQLENPSSLSELKTAMIDNFDEDRKVIYKDLVNFLDEMVSIGAVQVKH